MTLIGRDGKVAYMQPRRSCVFVLAALLGMSVFFEGAAEGQVVLGRQHRGSEGSAEVGLQAMVVGSGGSTSDTFLGAVVTVQGGHLRHFSVLFQLGIGAGLGEDPEDPGKTRAGEQAWVGLGARLRPLAFLAKAPEGLDLFVGPLLGALFNPDLVIFVAAADLGVAYRFGRLRLSLSAQLGWADVLHQAMPLAMKAGWCAGGLLSVGYAF